MIERVRDQKTRSLCAKVEVVADPELDEIYDECWSSIVEVYMKDGSTYHARRDLPKGEPEFPLSDDTLKDKFMDLACDAIPAEKAEKIYQAVWNLENLEKTSELTRLMRIA